MNSIVLLALKEEAPELTQYPWVFFTGLGKVNAAAKTAELIAEYQPKHIINFGTDGGITVSTGLHSVTKFVQRDMHCEALGYAVGETPNDDTDIMLDLGRTGLTCSTGDNFVADPVLEIPADLVDMESYAIAKVCLRKNVEFSCYKFVSDSADSQAHLSWTKLVSQGQEFYIKKLQDLGFEL